MIFVDQIYIIVLPTRQVFPKNIWKNAFFPHLVGKLANKQRFNAKKNYTLCFFRRRQKIAIFLTSENITSSVFETAQPDFFLFFFKLATFFAPEKNPRYQFFQQVNSIFATFCISKTN